MCTAARLGKSRLALARLVSPWGRPRRLAGDGVYGAGLDTLAQTVGLDSSSPYVSSRGVGHHDRLPRPLHDKKDTEDAHSPFQPASIAPPREYGNKGQWHKRFWDMKQLSCKFKSTSSKPETMWKIWLVGCMGNVPESKECYSDKHFEGSGLLIGFKGRPLRVR